MVINTEVLKQKINLYCNKEIEKEDLGLWAMEAYYALMRGEYIDIEKLKIYHFLRTISTFHMRPNDITGEYPCTENDVLEIKEILSGKREANYTFNIRIYKNIYQCEKYKYKFDNFVRLRGIIDEINVNKSIESWIIDELIDYVNQKDSNIQTIIDFLEENIRCIIAENIDLDERLLDFRQSVGIYIGGSEINKQFFIPNLKKLFDCVMGEMGFRISIIYRNGTANISFLLL